jgi:hypothetical protein
MRCFVRIAARRLGTSWRLSVLLVLLAAASVSPSPLPAAEAVAARLQTGQAEPVTFKPPLSTIVEIQNHGERFFDRKRCRRCGAEPHRRERRDLGRGAGGQGSGGCQPGRSAGPTGIPRRTSPVLPPTHPNVAGGHQPANRRQAVPRSVLQSTERRDRRSPAAGSDRRTSGSAARGKAPAVRSATAPSQARASTGSKTSIPRRWA